MVETHNKKRRQVTFCVGDQVLLSTKHPWFATIDGVRKLIPRYVGPFRVLRVHNEVTCKLELPEEMGCHDTFHASLLKQYHPRTRRPEDADQPGELLDGHMEFEVDAVIKHKVTRGKLLYKLSFVGYGPHRNRWTSQDDAVNCQRKIAEYWDRVEKGIGYRAIAQKGEPSLQNFPYSVLISHLG
jgi:hypothetical protein